MFWKNRKKEQELSRFTGEATILMADITKVDKLAETLSPEQLIDLLRKHIEKQSSIVSKHGGIVVQFIGSYINALWRDSDHAAQAVKSAREMLAAADERINFSIVIATESVAGDFFGPKKQYQLLGRAMDQADRLLKFPLRPKRSLLLTERTLSLIGTTDGEYTKVGLLKDQCDVFSLNV